MLHRAHPPDAPCVSARVAEEKPGRDGVTSRTEKWDRLSHVVLVGLTHGVGAAMAFKGVPKVHPPNVQASPAELQNAEEPQAIVLSSPRELSLKVVSDIPAIDGLIDVPDQDEVVRVANTDRSPVETTISDINTRDAALHRSRAQPHPNSKALDLSGVAAPSERLDRLETQLFALAQNMKLSRELLIKEMHAIRCVLNLVHACLVPLPFSRATQARHDDGADSTGPSCVDGRIPTEHVRRNGVRGHVRRSFGG
jgi:hypothetical protein